MRKTEAAVDEKVRAGVLRAPQRGSGVGEDFWRLPRPADPGGLALQALLDERRDGR